MIKLLLKNIRISFIAQLTGICVSVCMGLLLPRYLSIADYGYWQLYVVYSLFFEFLLFGIPNGYFLKNAGRIINDKDYLKTVFILIMSTNIIVSLIIIANINNNGLESYIYNLIAVGILIYNSGTFFSFMTRSENDIGYDCFVTALLNILLVCGILLLFYLKIYKISIIIIIYLTAFFIRDLFLFFRQKTIFHAKFVLNKMYFRTMLSDAVVGFKLLLIDYTNILLFGVCRILCKSEMGIIVFSKFSFALSLVILAINFVNQVSLSVLPALRQFDKNSIEQSYIRLRNFTSLFFLTLLISYKPAVFFLSIWLPKYADSFIFILMLFPLIVFDGKMQTIFSLFLKLLRKETLLLKINMAYLLISISLNFIIIHYTRDVEFLILSILVMSCLRSTIVEFLISKIIYVTNFQSKICIEIATGIIFLVLNFVFDGWVAWAFFMFLYVPIYCYNLKKCGITKLMA